MNRLLSFLAFASIISFAHAQNKVTDSTATVVGFWKNGETKYYRFAQKEWTQKVADTTQPKPVTTEYFAQIHVLDSNESGYTLEWVLKGVKSQNSPDPNSQRIFAISEGLRFLYNTDPSGAYGDILNLEEVRAHIYRGFDSMMADKSFIIEARENLGKIRDRMLEEANIEQLYIEDIRYFHYMYGYEFHKQHPMQFESELENAEGGEPLKAKNEISLNRVEQADDNIILLMSSSIDREQGKKLINAAKGAGAPGGGGSGDKPQIATAPPPTSLEIEVNLSYNFSIRTGWVKYYTYIKEVRTGDEYSVKRIDIRDFDYSIE